jgi:L-aspartate oxidase
MGNRMHHDNRAPRTAVSPQSGQMEIECDVAVVGGGVAGLSLALSLPEDLHVVVITKATLGESNTRYAQGGLAAAVGGDDDPALHLRDTLAAGAGLVDESAAHMLVQDGPAAVAWLAGLGAHFDAPASAGEPSAVTFAGRFALGREAAHSRRRVLHAHGDATGAEIERALVAAGRARANIRVLEEAHAVELLVEGSVCRGVMVASRAGLLRLRACLPTALANGGAGQLWLRTSNPSGATGDGLALAWRAGATLADLEFMQFHPTVLLPPTSGGDAFLISEAVRGEGAYLRNGLGERFMPRYHPDAELAPRDVVARAILSEMLAEGAPSAFLDLRHLPAGEMRVRFPSITAACARCGLDLARDLIPVAPAAHYFMGGVATDGLARTTLPGLYAVGEVACTGVHGANRLASNSLLEGLVFGRRAAEAIAQMRDAAMQTWPAGMPFRGAARSHSIVEPTVGPDDVTGQVRWALREVMWQHVGLRRDRAGLEQAQDQLRTLAESGLVDRETGNMLIVSQLIVAAALSRCESRGSHFRIDFPALDPALDGIHTLLRGRGRQAVHEQAEPAESASQGRAVR